MPDVTNKCFYSNIPKITLYDFLSSITRMNGGQVPDRKYFPASAEAYGNRDQSVLPLPGTLQPQNTQPPMQNSAGLMEYSAMEGLPPGLNGPNVIVVDTSSLKTKEEEEKEKEEKVQSTNKFFSLLL